MAISPDRVPSRQSNAPRSADATIRALVSFYRQPRTSWQLAVNGRRPVGEGTGAHEPPDRVGVNPRLQAGLVREDARDRLVLFLSYAEGWSVEHIAERLDISPMHCRKIRDRALARLADWDGQPTTDHET